ncbi:MAG: AAA family ATPase, partial [Planctomycetes bacterium]|nr:AAA family ATPase [Planctomycetota bacterium]
MSTTVLHSLHIRDLALIERAEVRFDSGLNVISGETGGGKSLVVTALELLRGGKASAGLVRHGADELRVDGEFGIGGGERSHAVSELVRESVGVEPEEGLVVVTRIVDRKGRSKVRINGRPSTLGALRELCTWLLEIHGQGESRALMRAEIQAETLDAFAGTTDLRGRFAEALSSARELAVRIESVCDASRERLQRVEFLRFQLAELEDLGLEAGETARLEEEHRVLANLDRLRDRLQDAGDALVDGEPSAGGLISRAERALQDISEIDHGLDEAAELCAELRIQCDEVARIVQSRLADLELEPGRLEQVEERLAAVRSAPARYGPGEDDLLARAVSIRGELDDLDADEQGAGELAEALRAAVAELARIGRRLVRARRKASAPFARAIEAELEALGMPSVRLQVGMADDFAADRVLEESSM